MSPALVSILAQIAASQARIAGMQSANDACRAVGNDPVYTIDSFAQEADQLDELSTKAGGLTS